MDLTTIRDIAALVANGELPALKDVAKDAPDELTRALNKLRLRQITLSDVLDRPISHVLTLTPRAEARLRKKEVFTLRDYWRADRAGLSKGGFQSVINDVDRQLSELGLERQKAPVK